ncbi:MAG: hypothetical protein R2856_23360 [Caldilineaceae bacterium]
MRTLLRRVSSLSYFHGDTRWDIDYRGWITQAETVALDEGHVHRQGILTLFHTSETTDASGRWWAGSPTPARLRPSSRCCGWVS